MLNLIEIMEFTIFQSGHKLWIIHFLTKNLEVCSGKLLVFSKNTPYSAVDHSWTLKKPPTIGTFSVLFWGHVRSNEAISDTIEISSSDQFLANSESWPLRSDHPRLIRYKLYGRDRKWTLALYHFEGYLP